MLGTRGGGAERLDASGAEATSPPQIPARLPENPQEAAAAGVKCSCQKHLGHTGRQPLVDTMVSKCTCAQACRRATAHNAKRFLDKLETERPFPIAAPRIDGGSEFKSDFEPECQRRGITLFEVPPRSPQLNGHVDRNHSAWRYEFYGCWNLDTNRLDDTNRWVDAFAEEFNTFRPHQPPRRQNPLAVPSTTHSPRGPSVSYVLHQEGARQIFDFKIIHHPLTDAPRSPRNGR